MGLLNPHKGSWFGLPDIGATEWLYGRATPQGGSDIIPNIPRYQPLQLNQQVGLTQPANNLGNVLGTTGQPQLQPQGQVKQLGAGTTTTGQTTDSLGIPATLYEQRPSEPDYNSLFDIGPAIQELEQTGQLAQTQYEGNVRQAEENQRLAEEQERTTFARAQRTASEQERATTARFREGAAEQRQLGGDLAKATLSQYGATQTGQIVGELRQREVAKNILNLRNSYQENVGKVKEYVRAAEENMGQALAQIAAEGNRVKEQAKLALQQAIREIYTSKAILSSQKREAALEEQRRYQQVLNAVDQRNASFQQQFWLQKQKNTESASKYVDLQVKDVMDAVIKIYTAENASEEGKQLARRLDASIIRPRLKDEEGTLEPVGIGAIANNQNMSPNVSAAMELTP